MFKWLFRSSTEQISCEKRVKNVMTRLKIENFHFNWDRDSCFIEFDYQEQSYKMEHSVLKANEKGVYHVKNGLDCLMELVLTLEDLCKIIERGTYTLEYWVSSMEQEFQKEEVETHEFPEYVDERVPRIFRMRH
ncbi:hypothetical protein [Niallia sp. Krafla_26]|uniref:hypothetical protein n=1 Tax=Niallia sp. Krafla_26 TaxID=3064703 RepID=UPI003D185DC3